MKSAGKEKTSQSVPGQSLLKFMDMASDAVKCALKKPTNFKRNINHRRYLQRQVKTYVKSRRNKINSSRKVTSSNLRDDVQDLVREAIKELKFSHCYANADTVQSSKLTAPPPRAIKSQLEMSCSRNMSSTYRLTHLPAEKPTMSQRELLYSCTSIKKESHQNQPVGLSYLHAEDEHFMSGEELTNNIDINDLYIPELHEPRSPVVKCEDYFLENDLEVPSPLYNSPTAHTNFQFHFDESTSNLRLPKFQGFL